MAYKIVRFFGEQGRRRAVVATGLSLEEAQAHCADLESSSATCTSQVGKQRTKRKGPWFDGYTAE